MNFIISKILYQRLKCDGKQHQFDVCEKLFKNYLVMVVHKRVLFGDLRPYKFVDYTERFNCALSLKTHYKIHKQQNLNAYCSDVLANNFPSTHSFVENKDHALKKMDFYNFTMVYFPVFLYLKIYKFLFKTNQILKIKLNSQV